MDQSQSFNSKGFDFIVPHSSFRILLYLAVIHSQLESGSRVFANGSLFTQKKRQGGDRATHSAETWATILAKRELDESLQVITTDLDMPYETVQTYAKLAKRAVTAAEEASQSK